MNSRRCLSCGDALDITSRSDRRTCSDLCRKRKSLAGQAQRRAAAPQSPRPAAWRPPKVHLASSGANCEGRGSQLVTDPAHAPEPMGAITGRLGFPERAIAPDQIRPEVVITHLSTVKPLPLEWLWQGYIPAGMITIIDGDPGLGKSMLTLDLVAKVTRGLPMPGQPAESAGRPRGAVLLSAEDDLAHTIVPRLIAAGADLDRVVVVSLRERDGTSREPIITPADLEAVEKAIVEVDAAIVIIDPLVAYLPATASANRDQDVRRTLAPLADLAERTGAAVVVVRHLRKAAADNALYRGGGSIAFIGAARVGLLRGSRPRRRNRTAAHPRQPQEQRRTQAAESHLHRGSPSGPASAPESSGVARPTIAPTISWSPWTVANGAPSTTPLSS